MKLLNILSRDEDSIIITYHWDRANPDDFCSKIKSLLPEESSETVADDDEPSGPDTAKAVELAMEVATITEGVEIIQGPWASRDQIRGTLIDLIEKSHPDLNQAFKFCHDCLC